MNKEHFIALLRDGVRELELTQVRADEVDNLNKLLIQDTNLLAMRIKQLESINATANEDKNKLEARVEELEGCLKHMREEHVRLMFERSRWEKEAADMKENWELCVEACDRLKQRIYPQEKANYILKMNMQAAQNTVRDLQTAVEGKELALAAQVAENSRLRQKLSECRVADMEDQKLATPEQATFPAGLIQRTEDRC